MSCLATSGIQVRADDTWLRVLVTEMRIGYKEQNLVIGRTWSGEGGGSRTILRFLALSNCTSCAVF